MPIVGWAALPSISALLLFFASEAKSVPPPSLSAPQLSQPELQTADLIAQQRMAQAAEDLLFYTNLGNWLLAFTLCASAIAALAGAAAALSARDSVRTAKQTAERQLRAYVGPSKNQIVRLTVGTYPRVKLTFKNYGQTPATNFTYGFKWKFAKDDSFQERGLPTASHPGSFTLNPGSTFATIETAPFVLTDKQLADIKTYRQRLYVWGQVEFDDIFKQRHSLRSFVFVSGKYLIDEKWMVRFQRDLQPLHDEDVPPAEPQAASSTDETPRNTHGQ